ncbi:hypothetical protein GCM10020220_024350 [Nonomuraea rubra]
MAEALTTMCLPPRCEILHPCFSARNQHGPVRARSVHAWRIALAFEETVNTHAGLMHGSSHMAAPLAHSTPCGVLQHATLDAAPRSITRPYSTIVAGPSTPAVQSAPTYTYLGRLLHPNTLDSPARTHSIPDLVTHNHDTPEMCVFALCTSGTHARLYRTGAAWPRTDSGICSAKPHHHLQTPWSYPVRQALEEPPF